MIETPPRRARRAPPVRTLALLVLALGVTLGSGPARALDLVAHRALYTLTRKSSTIESDVVGVNGRMQLTAEHSCDGWHVEQFLGFRTLDSEDNVSEHLAILSGFETANGRVFWFNTKSFDDRSLTDELSGVARVSPDGGEVRLAKPDDEQIDLPRGTLFPTAHIAALVAAARAGRHFVRRVVYDGSTLDSPYEVAAAIGTARRDAGARFPALAGVRAWPIDLAYYQVGTRGPEPDFQMSVMLFENGVAGDMVYDYGDFTVAVTLTEFEVLPTPKCPG